MSDQVTHTPTPWRIENGTTLIWGNCNPDDHSTRGMGYPIVEAMINPSGNWSTGPYADEGNANAEFIVLAVNFHDALTARVAELDVQIAKLRTSLIVVRAAIIRAPNDIITDTVWMPEEISMNETVVDFIDATLESEA